MLGSVLGIWRRTKATASVGASTEMKMDGKRGLGQKWIGKEAFSPVWLVPVAVDIPQQDT